MEVGENVELICSSNTWHLLHSTDYLLTLSSGVNVPCLSNKNSLERQLPQVKLGSFPDSSLLSVSIETLSIYLGKLKQLLSCPPRVGIQHAGIFIITRGKAVLLMDFI